MLSHLYLHYLAKLNLLTIKMAKGLISLVLIMFSTLILLDNNQ